MRIIGFLQNRNNVQNGYLQWCLESLARCTDEIVVYDDASTEDPALLYEAYGCIVLYAHSQAFHRELYHKQTLLQVALRSQPDWLIWIDADAILGPAFERRADVEKTLTQADGQGLVRLHLHNLNLWRSYGWYRTDQAYDDLWHGVCWKNTGELHYAPVPRLHQKQYPMAFRDPEKNAHYMRLEPRYQDAAAQLIHFGFATDLEIARKYFLYRAHGQAGWPLERLVSEQPRLNPQTGQEEERTLKPVEWEWYPQWWRALGHTPGPQPVPRFTPEDMERYDGLDAWRAAGA